MADPQLDIAPVTADPYVAETKDKLQALRKGLNIDLGPTPQIPTVKDVRTKLGPDVDKPIISFDEYTARQGLVRGQEENLSQIESAQKQRIGALESQQAQEQKIVEAQKKAYAADKANEVRRGQDAILQEMDATNSKEFHFSQENMQSIATLFSLLGVIAIGGGKGSRLSVMNTMNSLTGMMKGWQQGRADVWKREKEEFEKNMAKTRAKLEAYSKKAELAWKTMPYDIEKSNAMMDELVAETGSQIVREKAKLQGIPAVATYLNNLFTGYDTQFDKFMKSEKQKTDLAHQKKTEEDAAARLKLSQEQFANTKAHQKAMEHFRQQEINLRKQEVKLKETKDASGTLKPTGEVTKNYIGEAQLGADLKNLQDQLKDPELRKLIKDNRLESFLSEEGGKVGNQLLQTEIPSKLRKFISQAQSVRNNVYLSISGKAVTGGEAMRNYGTVPQPGDTAEVIDDKIGVLRKQIAGRQAMSRRLYGALPDLSEMPVSDGAFNVGALQVDSESAPAIPQGVPPSAQWSPSQKTWWWKDNDGKWQSKSME
jgi:hypothetical protein